MNTEETRVESDLLGSREIPAKALYGVQTLRGLENFPISKFHLNEYPLFINGLAITKMAAAQANHELGLLTDEQTNGIVVACQEILDGKHHEHFPVQVSALNRVMQRNVSTHWLRLPTCRSYYQATW